MSAVEEYREYSKCFYPNDRLADKADAALAEMEATLAESSEMYKAAMAPWGAETETRRKFEAALAEANAKYRSAAECSQDERDRAVAAEAALAERDRTLRLAETLIDTFERMWADVDEDHCGHVLAAEHEAALDAWYARAEEGSGT